LHQKEKLFTQSLSLPDMGRKKFVPKRIQQIEITKAGSEGVCIAHHDGKVIMVEKAVPGDIVDIREVSSKKKHSVAVIEEIIKPSSNRVDAFCEHHAICGGCKWQQMDYQAQLRYKHQQVLDAYERIGKFDFPEILPVIGAPETIFYRNKLEYSFTEKRWLTSLDGKDDMTYAQHAGLGYHVPGRFDKVFDVNKCWLMDDLHNTIRNRIQEYCLEHNFSFFNLYANEGFMRSLIFRNNPQGQWMLIVVFGHEDAEKRKALLEFIKNTFPQISSLVYIINEKLNDTINDLETQVYSGDAFLIQQLEDLKFKIGPKSFFQTNTLQTQKLYETARTFAQLSGNENVYDLYTGVGTIALFVAKQAKHVTGIEYVPEAIVDADMNAAFNGIANTSFFAGDMKQVLNDSLIQKEGKPDVIITDPPRAGMHEDVVKKIMELLPARIVYVSCNPATQARDIALMTELYKVTRVQPVDMFPHTHHVECVTLLERK